MANAWKEEQKQFCRNEGFYVLPRQSSSALINVHYGSLNNLREAGICLQTLEDPWFPLPNLISLQPVLDEWGAKSGSFGNFFQGKDLESWRKYSCSFHPQGQVGGFRKTQNFPVFGDSSVTDGSLGPSYNRDMENLCWESFFPSGMGKWWRFVDGVLYLNHNKPCKVLNPRELEPNKWQESSEFSIAICSDHF